MTVALAGIFRCPQLVQAHADRAMTAGASREDVAEALLVAAAAGAASHTRLTREVYDAYLDRLVAHFERLQR
jgi:AhpD family alkylhydroperoxidase